jgi:integrase
MPKKTNFTANGNNYYRVTATVGKNPDGSPIRKQFYGESKKAAEQKRDDYKAGLKRGLNVDYEKATFGVAFKHWFENIHRYAISISSYNRYEGLYRMYVVGCELASMRLIDIKCVNVEAMYNALRETTTPNNIRNINKLLKIFFNRCIEDGALVKSPLPSSDKLPKTRQEALTNTALTDSDIVKLINACNSDIKHFPYLFACFTGLRAGELLALNYKDLDFKDGMITVNKSVKYLTVDGVYKPILSDPKTKESNRRVPILPEIQNLLLGHIDHIKQTHNVISISGNFLLFPSDSGTYRDSGNFLKTFKRLCEKLNITKGCTVHSLRHTFCTILARQGVSLLDASRLMGHSSVNTTANIYSHVSDDDKKNAVQKLAAYF